MALDALRSTFRRSSGSSDPADGAQASTAVWPATPTFPAPAPVIAAEEFYDDDAPEPYGLPPQPFAADSERFAVPDAPSFATSRYATTFADPIAASGTEQHTFNCLECGRTLSRGARRCEGCGEWQVLDVPLRRAGKVSGAGALAGMVATLLLVNLFAPKAPAVTAAPVVDPGAGAGASAIVVSSGAVAALRGTTAINARLAAEAEPLSKALGAKTFKTADVVKIFRRMAIDTRAGAGMLKPMTAWPEAVGQQAALQAFYGDLERRIDAGLSSSVNSTRAYKKATKAVLATLRGLPHLDAGARSLAMQVGVQLPAVALP